MSGNWAIAAANWHGDQKQQSVTEQQGMIMFPNSKQLDIDLLAGRYAGCDRCNRRNT